MVLVVFDRTEAGVRAFWIALLRLGFGAVFFDPNRRFIFNTGSCVQVALVFVASCVDCCVCMRGRFEGQLEQWLKSRSACVPRNRGLSALTIYSYLNHLRAGFCEYCYCSYPWNALGAPNYPVQQRLLCSNTQRRRGLLFSPWIGNIRGRCQYCSSRPACAQMSGGHVNAVLGICKLAN
jgi:hypothetical protein